MNWKKFKNIFKIDTTDESYFILGIDIGNDSSSISFFNIAENSPEIIDISGGYGKPSIPTVMQYIPETKEWVYGEYAVLNTGTSKDITLFSIFKRLGKMDYIDLGTRSISVVNILGLYIKELIGNVKNINPTAEIAGIVISTPSYLSDAAKDELASAFKCAGYDKELIGLVTDKECILNRFYFDNPVNAGKVLMLDFGSREVRGGVLDVTKDANHVNIRNSSTLFDESIGTNKINERISELFTEYYCSNFSLGLDKLTPSIKNQINSFAYQHKDLLFQKNISVRPVRLYFNFAYPPFQKNINKDEINSIIEPFKNKFIMFLQKVLGENIPENLNNIDLEQIDTVICTGGGFEMLWAKKIVSDIFPNSQVVFFKNSKAAVSEGAAIVAAMKLDVIDEMPLEIEDLNLVPIDLGIKIISDKKEKFLPIVERNSFWWQKHTPKIILLGDKTDKPVIIPIYQRDSNGDINYLEDIVLEGLPFRPRGTSKIQIAIDFLNFNEVVLTAKDMGFGEFFPSTEYEKKLKISIVI